MEAAAQPIESARVGLQQRTRLVARRVAQESIVLLKNDGVLPLRKDVGKIAVVGPNGSGKTTLLRIIAGFESPSAGDVRIGGRSMTGVKPYRRPVGIVFQNLALFPHLSVGENVAFGLVARRTGAVDIGRQVAEVLSLVETSVDDNLRIIQFDADARENYAVFLRFRDALRASPRLVNEYNAVKRDAAGLGPDAYRNAKSAFIAAVLGSPAAATQGTLLPREFPGGRGRVLVCLSGHF